MNGFLHTPPQTIVLPGLTLWFFCVSILLPCWAHWFPRKYWQILLFIFHSDISWASSVYYIPNHLLITHAHRTCSLIFFTSITSSPTRPFFKPHHQRPSWFLHACHFFPHIQITELWSFCAHITSMCLSLSSGSGEFNHLNYVPTLLHSSQLYCVSLSQTLSLSCFQDSKNK